MKHKIAVNILSILTIVNLIPFVSSKYFNILSDMYASYSLADQMPKLTRILFNSNPIFIILLIAIIIFLICYNIVFNKKIIEKKYKAYKTTSTIAYIFLGILIITTLFLFIFCILKPLMEIYQASFLFEANGI